jgi:hypothetical protein
MTPTAEVSPRREYDTPDLTIYGDIAELTHGGAAKQKGGKRKPRS